MQQSSCRQACKVGIANLGQSQPFEVVANKPKFMLWVVCDYPKHLSKKVLKMENSLENANNLLITSSESYSEVPLDTLATMPSDAEWGLDTVSLSIPVTDTVQELAHNSWELIAGSQTEKVDKTKFISHFNFGFATVTVTYLPLHNSLYLQFNAARLLSRKSAELLPPNALQRLVEALLFDLVPQIPVLPTFMSIDEHGTMEMEADWSSQVKLTRLDCARNFYVDCPEYVRHALSHVKGKYQKLVHIYYDDEGWTRANETKSAGMDRIYDKSAELRNLELDERFHWDKRVYRFEAQLQKDRLKKFGVTTLDRISDEAVWNVLQDRWKACEWGIKLPGKGGLDDIISALNEKDRIPFLGYLSAHAEGMTDNLDAKALKRLSKLASQIGVVPGLPLSSYRPMTRVLSLWHGTSVEV